jgi:hypothetical protein
VIGTDPIHVVVGMAFGVGALARIAELEVELREACMSCEGEKPKVTSLMSSKIECGG